MSATTATVSVETKELLRVLNLAGKCISSKPSMPILGDVLLACNEGKFLLSASNAELWIDVPADMRLDDGELVSVCVNYAMLRNAVATLPLDTTLKMVFNEGRLKVDYGKGKFSVTTDDSADYPIPSFRAESESAEKAYVCRFKTSDGWLINNMRLARTCAAVENIRPTLNAVCVDVFKDKVNVASTDAMVMYYNSRELSADSLAVADFEEKAQMIISLAAVDALTACFGSEELSVATDGAHISVSGESGVKLVARLVDGNYIPYEQIIFSQADSAFVKVAAEDMLGALKRCGVFASEVSHMAILTADAEKIRVTVDNLDFATNCNEEVTRLEGSTFDSEIKIGFNLVKLSSQLGAISARTVFLYLSDEKKPIIVKEDNEASRLVLLTMPMSI